MRERTMLKLAMVCFFPICFTTILSGQTSSWSWSYSGTSGTHSTSATGHFVTVDEGGGNNLITDVTGVWNGFNVTGVLVPGADFNDNILTSAKPYVDSNGFAFSTADNHWINLWSADGVTAEWVTPAGDTGSLESSTSIKLTVTADAAPWEPADGIAIAAIAIFGFKQYRRRCDC